jgi:hypothetical protein
MTKLQEFDPILTKKLQRDIDFYEIRGHDITKINNWIANALITEQLIELLRVGFISVVGCQENGEPIFEQSTD